MPIEETLVHVFWERVRNTPDRAAILHKVNGHFRPVIWREHGRVVELLCSGLLKQGVHKADKIALLAQNSAKWTWADLGILSTGAITVPIYPSLRAAEIDYMLQHSDASGIFIENPRQLAKLLSVDPLPAALRFVVLMEGDPPSMADSALKILKWEDLLKDGEVFLLNHVNALTERINSLKPADTATIVYTSGTTGIPKGAILLHRNLHFVCQTLSLNVGFHPDDISLSFLPLSHIFERVSGQFLAVYEGLVMAYAESMECVPQNMVEVRPTIMNAVPRFYEKAYYRIMSEIRQMPKPQQYLVRWALSIGKRATKLQLASPEGSKQVVKNIYRAELRIADRLVFSRIRRRFGGRLRFLVSGAAPLSQEVHQFFDTIGMPIIEGYGLSETAAPVSCNTPYGNKAGTVGRPLPGLTVKIASDGEVMIRGPSVFAGYYKDEEGTKLAFENGWFLTGDIGEIDSEGYLIIKDRKKDIIITAGGKHVAPQFIENLFAGEQLLSRIFVYGDRRKYVTALITLNPEGLTAFAQTNAISYANLDELVHHPLVLKELEAMVNKKNEQLATFEQIKKFVVLEQDFSIENDELTPTMKLKRRVIVKKHQSLLDSLYDANDLQLENAGSN